MDAVSARKVQRRYIDVRNEIRNVYQLIFMIRQGRELTNLPLTMEQAERIIEDLVVQRDVLREKYPEIVRTSKHS